MKEHKKKKRKDEIQHTQSKDIETRFIRHNLFLMVVNPLDKENVLLFIWTLAIHSVTRKAEEKWVWNKHCKEVE